MKLKIGNLFNDIGNSILLFTSNATLNSRNQLVMGAGSALSFKILYPALPSLLGEKIKGEENYGCIILKELGLGCFQTKRHWRDNSTLQIIQNSTNKLLFWIDEHNYERQIALPFPGIGKGGLSEEEVIPIISVLPDNVIVYKLR